MSDLNSVSIVGRLTRNAESKTNANGLVIVSFSMAINHSKKHGDEWIDEPTFVSLAIFGKRAESLFPYLTKGRTIGITGHFESRIVEKDNRKYSLLSVIPQQIHLYNKPDTQAETEAVQQIEEIEMPVITELANEDEGGLF